MEGVCIGKVGIQSIGNILGIQHREVCPGTMI